MEKSTYMVEGRWKFGTKNGAVEGAVKGDRGRYEGKRWIREERGWRDIIKG